MAFLREVFNSPLSVCRTLSPKHDLKKHLCRGVRRGSGGFHGKDEEANPALGNLPNNQGH